MKERENIGNSSWVIADTWIHFLHTKIAEYCNRPKDFNKLIIKNWNSLIKPGDFVLHLGDFSAGVNAYPNGLDILKKISNKLNGDIYLLKGNHDHYSNDFYLNELGLKGVAEYFIIDKMYFCHYPLKIDKYTKSKIKTKIIEHVKRFKENKCKYLVHGHTHNNVDNSPINGNRFNVSVELTKYKPIKLDLIEKYFTDKNKE